MLSALIRLARPTHWVKNGFVAGPLIFANPQSLGVAVVQSATAVAVFSLMASAIYCFNDVIDAESDRAHPTKRARPIAAGLVTPQLGVAWGAVLANSSRQSHQQNQTGGMGKEIAPSPQRAHLIFPITRHHSLLVRFQITSSRPNGPMTTRRGGGNDGRRGQAAAVR